MKKINSFIWSSIFMSILFLIMGVILILQPELSLSAFSYVIAAFLIGDGIALLITHFSSKNQFWEIDHFTPAILAIVLGIVIFMYPSFLSTLIPIILGIWLVVSSIIKLRFSSFLKEEDTFYWVLTIIMALLTMICGIVFIIRPLLGAVTITLLLGTLLIISSVADIIEMFLFKSKINQIKKHLKKVFKELQFEE